MDGLIAYALSKKYADEVGQSILDAGFKTQVEQDRSILQTVGQEKILYFIPKTTAKPSDGYDEYVYSNNAWEQVGVTDVDLSSYATKAEVGNLNNLPTTDKSSIVSAISETFTSVSNGKSLVASAITDKGISTSSDATFSEMAQNIEAIQRPFFSSKGAMYFSNMTIPDSVTSIKDAAYIECYLLNTLEISGTVKQIGNSAFENDASLSVLILHDGIERIYNKAFFNINVTEIILPSSIKIIGSASFFSKSQVVVDLSAFLDPNNIPVLNDSNGFNINTLSRMDVANQEMYDAFSTATNWSTYALKYAIKGAT